MSLTYKHPRYPVSIIAYALWLYHRLPSSLRLVEEALSYRGLDISYETIRRWSKKFAHLLTNQLKARRAKPKGKWHIDEVYIKIKGQRYWLWRAIDEDGYELDIFYNLEGMLKQQGGSLPSYSLVIVSHGFLLQIS